MKKLVTLFIFLCFACVNTAQNNKKSEKAFKKAIAATTDGNYDQAIELFSIAIKKSKKNYKSDILLIKGMTYQIMKEDELAIEVYNEVIANYPNESNSKKAISLISLIENPKHDKAALKLPNGANKEDLPSVTQADLDSDRAIDYVHSVPVYPGCEDLNTNKERSNCLSQNIAKLISRHYDTYLATQLNLSGSRVIIRVACVIDARGNVNVFQIKGDNPYLNLEARRVFSLIPQVTPKYDKGTPIGNMFTIPIVFSVMD